MLFAYDWILKHLVPNRAIIRQGRSSSHVTKIGVCGELIGGGLAAMLALTECRLGQPHIAAAAINEPLVDWIFPEPEPEPLEPEASEIDDPESFLRMPRKIGRRKRSKKAEPSFTTFAQNGVINASDLLYARQTLFRNPENYFDPFASPVHFFRSPGQHVPQPPSVNPLDEFEEAALYEREDFLRQQQKLAALSNLTGELPSTSPPSGGKTDDEQPKPRKGFYRFPALGSGLKLPDMRVSFGDTSPLADQAVELALLMRRSSLQDRTFEAEEEKEGAVAMAEQRFGLGVCEGIGLWSRGYGERLAGIGRWFGEVLR